MNIREQCNSISKLIFAGRWSLTEFNGCQRNIIQCCIQNACHATSFHLYHVYNLIKWQLWLDVVKQNITTEIPEQLSDRACNTMLNLSPKTVNVTFKSMLKRMKPIVTSNENVAEYYFFFFSAWQETHFYPMLQFYFPWKHHSSVNVLRHFEG